MMGYSGGRSQEDAEDRSTKKPGGEEARRMKRTVGG
jgi:hypothetical protein